MAAVAGARGDHVEVFRIISIFLLLIVPEAASAPSQNLGLFSMQFRIAMP